MYLRPQTRQTRRTADLSAWPAPTAGLIANRALATPEGTPGAQVLENFFPASEGVTIRRGSELHATVGGGTPDVQELFTYSLGNQEEFFAATTTNIYDITVAASPVSVASGKTSGDWVFVQFATVGGTFLIGVNGSDPALIYNGTAWSATTITGVNTATLSHVWAYKNRLFFVQKNTLSFWYLAIDSIGGPATEFPMGGIFTLGGSLLFGSSWSIESADGLDSRCIFATGHEHNAQGNEGEIAVFAGLDPDDPNQWGLIGVYRNGHPLGKKAHMRAGGDVIIATDLGFIPLSVALQRDVAALAPSSLSFAIEDEWAAEVEARGSAPWKCKTWPSGSMTVVMTPTVVNTSPKWFVGNVRTGAWCTFTGWDAHCVAVYQDRLYFGSSGGKIVQAYVTGFDQGEAYTATCVPLFQDLGTPASLKVPTLARAVLRSPVVVTPSLAMMTDFEVKLPAPPPASFVQPGSVWGIGIWGPAIPPALPLFWGGSLEVDAITVQRWVSVSGLGYTLAPALQITSGSLQPLDAKLIRIEALHTTAEVVT